MKPRTATTQCHSCSRHVPEGLTFCKCGACLQLGQGIFDKIRERFRALIGSYYVPEINARGKRHGIKQWQEDHVRAKDATRGAKKRTGNPSILARFQEDEWYRHSQIEKLGWTEAFCRYLDYIVTIDISHQASQVQRHGYESTVHLKWGDSTRQLGPT